MSIAASTWCCAGRPIGRGHLPPRSPATRSRRFDGRSQRTTRTSLRDAIEQRSLRDARFDPVGNGRWFAAPADGEPGASCVLYERDGIGQVETVGTRPEDRGRGLASAVVLAASDASRRAGHELTFIVADADDWPWKLYERLGFDPIGEKSDFLRKPPQLSGESP